MAKTTNEFIEALEVEFLSQQNVEIAAKQSAYMRNQFEFYGLKSEVRRDLQKPFFVKAYLPAKTELHEIVHTLWAKPQRDFQLFSQELVFKYVKQFEKKDIVLLEYMVTHKSWWDTVDYIAYKLMGAYFKSFPDEKKKHVEKWLNSGNIWLQRSALLFQLKYKQDIDVEILERCIVYLLGSKEFFIKKAIGWVLREYTRTNPAWVVSFAKQIELAPLSKKEALRLLK